MTSEGWRTHAGSATLGHMNTAIDADPNDALRALIESSGLTQAEALARFNKGLFQPYSLSGWKAYFCSPDSVRFRRVPEDVLKRARRVLGRATGKK